MIDLTKTYKLRNEKRCKLINQPRIRSAEADPGMAYVLEAEWEDKDTGEVSTELWTAEGQYYAGYARPHAWDLVEVEVLPKKPKLDPSKKYRLRDADEYELVGPLVFGTDQTAQFPIAAQVRKKRTGSTFWWTWKADGSWTTDGRKMDYDLIEDTPEWKNWPIDAKVLCRDRGDPDTYKGYYAGERKGRPTAWASGATSWSGATRPPCDWDEIKLAEEQPIC